MHKRLNYGPAVDLPSVTAYGRDQILVAENMLPAIHVYDLNGEEIHHLTHQDLGLQPTGLLYAIRYNSTEEILHVHFGNRGEMAQTVCAYKVQWNN